MSEVRQGEAWHLAQLRTLERILGEMGNPTQLLEKSTQIPYHGLLTRLQLPGDRPALEMAMTFYPVSVDEVKHSLLLQYFSEMPLTLDSAGLSRLGQLLSDLNSKTVLGHFGITVGRKTLHYRYVQTLPAYETITATAVTDVILLVGYTPALFIDLLEGVANEQISVDEAKAHLASRYPTPGAPAA